MQQLGGQAIYLGQTEVGLGQRESVADVARVLSRYVDGIAARTYAQQTLVDLATYANVPIVNALSDEEHPCQAVADLLTVYERKGHFHGLTLAFIGDGNNVATSLAQAAAMVGMNFVIASPEGYELSDETLAHARQSAAKSGARIEVIRSPQEAVKQADVVYTDVWISMGQEDSSDDRLRAFAGYQVNRELLSQAPRGRHPDARPAGASRRRDSRRGDRRAAVRRVRPGREPPARAEGHTGAAAGGELDRR